MNKKYLAFSAIAISLSAMAGVNYLKTDPSYEYGPRHMKAESPLLKFRTGDSVVGLDVDGNGAVDYDEPRSSSTISDGGVSFTITEDGDSNTVVWHKKEKVNDGVNKTIRTVLVERLVEARWMRVRELYDGTEVRECSDDNASWGECELHGI